MFYNNLPLYSGTNVRPTSVNVNTSTNSRDTIIETIVTDLDYYINLSDIRVYNRMSYLKFDYIVIKSNNLFLPILDSEFVGSTFRIINNTGKLFSVYTQNGQMIYNLIYTGKDGNVTATVNNKSISAFYLINTNGVLSWIMSIN